MGEGWGEGENYEKTSGRVSHNTNTTKDPTVHFQFEHCELNAERRELTRHGQIVALGPQVFDLLLHLIRHRDRVVSKEDLLAAIWAGLLYDDASLDAAWELVKDWTTEERWTLRTEVPRTAIHTKFRKRTVAEIGDDVLALALEGLQRRGNLDAAGNDETQYLGFVEGVLADRKTAADRWLDRYNGAWAGDLTRIFDEAEI